MAVEWKKLYNSFACDHFCWNIFFLIQIWYIYYFFDTYVICNHLSMIPPSVDIFDISYMFDPYVQLDFNLSKMLFIWNLWSSHVHFWVQTLIHCYIIWSFISRYMLLEWLILIWKSYCSWKGMGLAEKMLELYATVDYKQIYIVLLMFLLKTKTIFLIDNIFDLMKITYISYLEWYIYIY